MNLHNKYSTLLKRNGIDTPLRLAHFFAQLEHESNLRPVSENLNYSAGALRRVFGRYFSKELAELYARQPERIANRVYANRMENGNEASGDGWRFRGRGFIQITGKRNYRTLTNDTGIDYINNPDLLLTEADSMISAIWYWNRNAINAFADADDLDGVSDVINIGRKTARYGDANGFRHRLECLLKYKKTFNSEKL